MPRRCVGDFMALQPQVKLSLSGVSSSCKLSHGANSAMYRLRKRSVCTGAKVFALQLVGSRVTEEDAKIACPPVDEFG